jgi:hypothetical protein
MDRESILRVLRQDLDEARKRREIASARFDEVLKDIPSGVPYPDSAKRIQRVSSEYAETQTAALSALMRPNDFLIYGTVPPGLEKDKA